MRNLMFAMISTLGASFYGCAIGSIIFHNDYKTASIELLIASTLYIIGYFTERINNVKENKK